MSLLINTMLIVGIGAATMRLGGPRYLAFKLSKGDDATGVSAGRREHIRVLDADLQPGAIVFVGDSITEMVQWSEVFGPQAINRGIGGDTTSRVLARIESIALQKPAKVFLLLGINDLASQTPQGTAERYRAIVQLVRATSPTTAVYVQSTLPVNNSQRATGRDNAAVRRLNAAVEPMVTSLGAQWVDLSPAMADSAGNLRSEFTHDGLHLNGAGISAWTSRIRPLVR